MSINKHEFEFCKIPGCSNQSHAFETNNWTRSKSYCSEHRINGVTLECVICKETKVFSIKAFKRTSDHYRCKKCVAIENIGIWNKSAEGKAQTSRLWHENTKKWRESEKVIEFARELGSNNMIKLHSDKDKHEAIMNTLSSPEVRTKATESFIKNSITKINNIYKNLDLPDLEIQGIEIESITHETFSKYKGISGVWSIWSGEICLDVAETTDLALKMSLFIRKYSAKKKRKYVLISEHENISFKIIKTGIDKTERELLEAQYAAKHQAIYWTPAPGQLSNIETNQVID